MVAGFHLVRVSERYYDLLPFLLMNSTALFFSLGGKFT